jgi:hypothetical protein
VKRLAGVATLAVIVCCACSASKASTPTTTTKAPAPPTEDQWLGHYALWIADLRTALEHADRPALESCGGSLEQRLGQSPPSLREPERILARACARFAKGARAEDDQQAFSEWSQAARLVREANSRLPTPQAMEQLPLPAGRGVLADSHVEPLLTEVATDIAVPVAQVRCWSRSDWPELQKVTFGQDLDLAGFASPAYKRVNLAWDICNGLATIAYTHERPDGTDELEIAFAVTTLMHEAGHLNESGDFYGAGQNEPLAECWGLQHIRQAAVKLGASRAYANELAARYWTEVYPTRPSGYRTKKCRNGGA